MFHPYCNVCFRRQKFEPDLEFHVSRCGHIICKQCLKQKCPMCKKPYNAVEIRRDMPAAMSHYFENPIKHYRHFQKVMKFQYDQYRRLVEYFYSKNEVDYQKTKKELEGYHKLGQKVKEQLDHERERVRKLKEYIAYYERRLEQARYMTPPIVAQPRPRYPARNKNNSDSGTRTTPVAAEAAFNCMPNLTQTVRAHYPPPRSPTLSNNTGSGSEVSTAPSQIFRNKTRTPPPLLPCSQHQKKTKHHPLSFSKFRT